MDNAVPGRGGLLFRLWFCLLGSGSRWTLRAGAGTQLTGVKLVKRQQDTVVFYILEAYQVVDMKQAA